MDNIKKHIAVWQNKRFVFAVVVFLAFSGVALGSKIPLFSSWLKPSTNGPELTIIARADGTFDIKEFAKKNQWFDPEVVGKNLEITANRQFGRSVKPGNISILLLADPGVKDETIRVALVSARRNGFHRIGFTDPHVGEIVREVANTASPVRRSGVRTRK